MRIFSTHTTIAAAPVPGKESARQFVTALATALTNRDAAFLRARLHPVVVQRYGDAVCTAYAQSAGGMPITFTAKDVRPPGVYKWETDGQSADVPGTNDVVVTQVAGGTTSERTIHIALVDGLWRWFTDCTP